MAVPAESEGRVAIMQPYFLPYAGYFQLISGVDVFVVYDNIKHTKSGWINRNRMLQQGQPAVFSIPLKRGSDSLEVRERELAAGFNKSKLLNRLRSAYRKAPHFEQAFPIVEKVVRCTEANLFRYLHYSISTICDYLRIRTPITISSQIAADHSLGGQDRVLAICDALDARVYVNAIGGRSLYDAGVFRARGLELRFIQSAPLVYRQLDGEFVPSLSIVDAMMFNRVEDLRDYIAKGYELVP